MGFLTEALTEEITIDPEEIAEARWFTRDEVREMVARAATGESCRRRRPAHDSLGRREPSRAIILYVWSDYT